MQMYELFSQRNKFDLKRFIPCHFHNFFFCNSRRLLHRKQEFNHVVVLGAVAVFPVLFHWSFGTDLRLDLGIKKTQIGSVAAGCCPFDSWST